MCYSVHYSKTLCLAGGNLNSKMLLVNAGVLPDVYLKVIEAKKLLASGVVKTASEASAICGISRSAYYKYKDYVFEYTHPLGEVVSLHAVLRDKAGVLSNFLQTLYSCGGNILTVNQGLPASGVASVSVSLRVYPESLEKSGLIEHLRKIDGVVSVKQLHGE